jgi:uncharacterized protein YvpB
MSHGAPLRRGGAGDMAPLRQAPGRRRAAAPPVVWLVLAGLGVVALACAALGALVWHKAGQVRALQDEVRALQGERQATEDRLVALQGTATALEDRLVLLEANDPAQQIAALQAAVEAATGSQQVAELRTSLADVQSRVAAFQAALDELGARMEALAPQGTAGALPAEARLQVTPQRQAHNLSCESAAASMAARYLGLDLGEADVLAALPRSENPHLGFRGSVDGPTGGIQDYGVYAGPIRDVLSQRGLQAQPVPGGLDGIRAAVARGHPVIAWVTYQMAASTPVDVTIGGQQVTLVPNQHVVLVTGYNADGFWANDPWDGREHFYAASDLERGMSYFDGMALEVSMP